MVLTDERESEDDQASLARRRKRIEGRFSGPWAINVTQTMLSWQVAMRVSAVEVYLQDALTFLGVYDAEFMRTRRSEQPWDYDAMRLASDADDALWTFCTRWSRGFVADGGPKRWAAALARSGLGKFDAVDVTTLEAMWGYRHLRIHNGGRLARDFAVRHRSVAEALWRDGLQLATVRGWADAADAFVAAAEAGIAGRLRARLGPELIAEREQIEFERQMRMWDDRMWRNLASKYPDDAARIDAALADPDEEVRGRLRLELIMRESGITDLSAFDGIPDAAEGSPLTEDARSDA